MKNLLLCLLTLIVAAPAWGESAAPVSSAGVVIDLKGPSESVSALVAELEKDAAYKAASCETAKAAEGATKVKCAKADGLEAFLKKNAPENVKWSATAHSDEFICKAGCVSMPCPSTVMCCSTSTHKPCP